MPSVVYGPGKREGMSAVLPARPTSAWECLADRTDGMTVGQLRRVSMLLLRVVCAWRLEDIGKLFDLHKGHVSREIDRAREELAEVLRDAGIDAGQYAAEPAADDAKKQPVKVRLFAPEADVLKREAARISLSESKLARLWLLAGGLSAAIAASDQQSATSDQAEDESRDRGTRKDLPCPHGLPRIAQARGSGRSTRTARHRHNAATTRDGGDPAPAI